jgi:competence protein ComFA
LLSPKYFIYMAVGAEGKSKLNISSSPRVDAYYLSQYNYNEMDILQPPQPIWIAEIILQKLSATSIDHPVRFMKLASSLLKELLPQKKLTMECHNIHELKLSEFNPPDIESLLWGRSLLGTEIPELLRVNGFDLPWDPEDWLQYSYLKSKVKREAAVSVDKLGLPLCRRCGERTAIMEDNCIFCGGTHCLTCTNCQTMGLAKSCIPMYSQIYPDQYKIPLKALPQLEFELTPPQQRASEAVVKFVGSAQSQFLVWAVCGAGKTEVSYGALAKVLSSGERALFAIPRKDVVRELAPRIQRVFPEIAISALYGGSGEHFPDVPLTIATTHQCLRFYQSFDLVVLDEADAYPYQGSVMLHYAVKRALKPNGHLIIMTATPSQSLIRQTRSGGLPYVSIPARHHRKPLIIPEYFKLDTPVFRDLKKDWKPAASVQEFLFYLKSYHRRGLIFLPTISLIEAYGADLISWAATYEIPGEIVHSKSVNREDAKSRLLGDQIQFIVTSTIFERGITIPNLDVMVLFADNERIFDSQTLIQISGRAGRMGEVGRVFFVAKTESRSMKEAIQIIKGMNREGFELGYLDSERN